MGGGGALRLALTRPDIWAAVAVLCAATGPGSEEIAGNALDLPVRFFHGEQDPIVPVASSRAWQRRLLDLGAPVEYIEYPAVRHNVWDLAYKNGAIFEWFAQFRRNRFPERVRFVTASYSYVSAYWVRIDGLTPGTPAAIDAKRVVRAVQVQTRSVDGFSLAPGAPVAAVTVDGASIAVKPGANLSFVKVNGRWAPGHFNPPGKRPGAEGPIAAALEGRQLYVYGSRGARTAAELEDRRKIAEHAARWAPRLEFAVKPDSEVTTADLATSDLILFGTRETNSAIEQLAPTLPLALSPGAADYGLLFVAPAGRHYVLVNSGLPFWTGAEAAARGGDPFAPPTLRLLSTFGDYVLFRGSLAQVIQEGRFDREWKVPAAPATKMTATGTVTVR
jgi:hypothetical protein